MTKLENDRLAPDPPEVEDLDFGSAPGDELPLIFDPFDRTERDQAFGRPTQSSRMRTELARYPDVLNQEFRFLAKIVQIYRDLQREQNQLSLHRKPETFTGFKPSPYLAETPLAKHLEDILVQLKLKYYNAPRKTDYPFPNQHSGLLLDIQWAMKLLADSNVIEAGDLSQLETVYSQLEAAQAPVDHCLTLIGGSYFTDPSLESLVSWGLFHALQQLSQNLHSTYQDKRLVVCAAATMSGVMYMVGESRLAQALNGEGFDFNLIGLCHDERTYATPTAHRQPQELKTAALAKNNADMYHGLAHDVVVCHGSKPGTEGAAGQWMQMSDWLLAISDRVATRAPGAKRTTLLVGGGDITTYELLQEIQTDQPVKVLGGMGRLSDQLATLAAVGFDPDQASPADAPLLTQLLKLRPPIELRQLISIIPIKEAATADEVIATILEAISPL